MNTHIKLYSYRRQVAREYGFFFEDSVEEYALLVVGEAKAVNQVISTLLQILPWIIVSIVCISLLAAFFYSQNKICCVNLRNSHNFLYHMLHGLCNVKRSPKIFIPVLIISIILHCISLLAAFFYSNYITKPIVAISALSKKMSDMELDCQCDESRHDEIGILAHSLNEMAANLFSTLRRRRNQCVVGKPDKQCRLVF